MNTSLWREVSIPHFPTLLSKKSKTQIVVVGAGITGLTAAVELAKHGKKVILLEGLRIGSGTTGNTSAHLTIMPDPSLKNFIATTGTKDARKILAGLQSSIDYIESACKGDCDFARVNGYLFDEKFLSIALEEEMQVAEHLHLPTDRVTEFGLPYKIASAIRLPHQAQFHPLKYLKKLAETFIKLGGTIYENTRVTKIDKNLVHCGSKTIECDQIILATHTPIEIQLSIHARLLPYLSFLLAVKVNENEMPGPGLYWDIAKPYHYLRSVQTMKGKLLLVGGADRRTGEVPIYDDPFADLKRYCLEHFPSAKIEYQWLGEFFEPADGIPYIGKIPFLDNVYTASGYSGNGLTYGTLAARMIVDQILDTRIYEDLREITKISRLNVANSAKNIWKETVSSVKHMIGDRIQTDESEHNLKPGEGRVLRVDGRMTAQYWDGHRLQNLSATCPHAGCIVQWNSQDATWDCPCHGSRFSCHGEVLEGPATSALRTLDSTPHKEPPKRFKMGL